MASNILSHVVSDLCIGKPAVRVLPQSTPIAVALATLRAGADPFVFVDAAAPSDDVGKKTATAFVVKVSVAEILCYVCGDIANLSDPAAALSRPVSVLTAAVGDHGVTRRVDPQTSLLDAIDALLATNSHSLVVPLHMRAGAGRKKHHHAVTASYCLLTQQDIVRHLFGSISLFSRVAALTISSLGLIRRDFHAVNADDEALAAIPLLRRSIGLGTAVAVVAGDDDALVGEICPGVLDSCDVEPVSAAFAALSAGDAMTYVDCYFSPPEFLLRSIRTRLTDKGLHAMRGLMDAANATEDTVSTTLSSPSSASSTSSDEESPLARSGRARRMSSSGSFRWRSTEDVAACNAGNSLVAVMAQALAHRVGHVWVVDEVTGALVGVVRCADVLAVLRDHLRPDQCYSDGF